MENWKSTGAFIIFIIAYIYTIAWDKADMVEVAGYIALYSSIFMMLRSEMTSELLGKVIDNMGTLK